MKLFKWIIITVITLKAKSILQFESRWGVRPCQRVWEWERQCF